MIIEPKIRGFICTTAHPIGCAQRIVEEIAFVKQHGLLTNGPKKVLVIGGSTGYGLATLEVCAFGAKAQTMSVFFERPAEGNRPASPGWYNMSAFEEQARQAGLSTASINGDAFSSEVKAATIERIRRDWQGEVDLVVYSVAAPRRQHPFTGEVFKSTLKPVGQAYRSKTIDVMTGKVSEILLEPATEQEIAHTIAVMGGEDWQLWLQALSEAKVLAKGVITLAYSYIGPEITYPIYREGTIGKAKLNLEQTVDKINQQLHSQQGKAYISVNKAVVTQASAAIPVVPLYVALLYKIMKEKNLHEGCIEQISRLFTEKLYPRVPGVVTDARGLIRLDDWEMLPEIQQQIRIAWPQINTENVETMTDLKGYRQEFYQLFGFCFDKVNYNQAVELNIPIISLQK